jgi:hypothetical protein
MVRHVLLAVVVDGIAVAAHAHLLLRVVLAFACLAGDRLRCRWRR